MATLYKCKQTLLMTSRLEGKGTCLFAADAPMSL